MTKRNLAAALLACLLLIAPALPAEAGRTLLPPPSLVLNLGQEQTKPQALALPYVFKTESLGVAYGVAAGATAYLQPQMGMSAAVMGSGNGSRGVYLVAWNLRLPYAERLFVDPNISWGSYADQRFYVPARPGLSGPRAGSNDSDGGSYLQGKGEDNWVELRFRYVLPLGHARERAMPRYLLKKGLLASGASGGETWNPLQSGVTLVELRPFWRERTLDHESLGTGIRRSLALELALVYNNTDFPTNPSKGSIQRLALTRDFGVLEDSDPWTLVEAEYAAYWDLGAGSWSRQNVLAFNLWTAHCLTWEENPGGSVSHRPPPYLGSQLGGFWRMRGYPTARFNDRSAIYYTAELRHIPQWQPLPEISWLRWADIDWWQFVLFGEAGRVAGNWSLGELHSDMHWDAGVSLRIMAIKSVLRLDVAYSEEGVNVWAMVGHPF